MHRRICQCVIQDLARIHLDTWIQHQIGVSMLYEDLDQSALMIQGNESSDESLVDYA